MRDLDQLVLAVSDRDHSNSFYCDVVGAEPVERQGARGSDQSVYFRDPDGSLIEFISYA